ncbi:MAG TPA: hypothetical protein VFI65_05770, partial [Streptosporangiaceae bacterium]|nr:hypothetical protein [Streptosporangiaceae bacterium]
IWAPDGDFTSLAGLAYPVGKVTWHQLTTPTGSNPGTCDPPSYVVIKGVVYITGTWELPGAGPLALLPPGARPSHRLFLVVGGDAVPNTEYSVVQINPDGSITTEGDIPNRVVSLEGLSFRVGV